MLTLSSLAQYISPHPAAVRMQLLTVLGRPSNASFNPQIGQWAANEVVPAALEACLGANVMASTGTAIVTMIKEFHDFDYLKTRQGIILSRVV